MTSVSRRTVTKSWLEITMPKPADRAEIYLALHHAEDAYEHEYGKPADHDLAFEVDADDEQIIIRIELKAKES